MIPQLSIQFGTSYFSCAHFLTFISTIIVFKLDIAIVDNQLDFNGLVGSVQVGAVFRWWGGRLLSTTFFDLLPVSNLGSFIPTCTLLGFSFILATFADVVLYKFKDSRILVSQLEYNSLPIRSLSCLKFPANRGLAWTTGMQTIQGCQLEGPSSHVPTR